MSQISFVFILLVKLCIQNRPLSVENVIRIEFLLRKKKIFIKIMQKCEYKEGFFCNPIFGIIFNLYLSLNNKKYRMHHQN